MILFAQREGAAPACQNAEAPRTIKVATRASAPRRFDYVVYRAALDRLLAAGEAETSAKALALAVATKPSR